ncbi:DUF2147 domain-containing protein [Psychrobacter sp. 2Y5]|uniref:DUF2147 domain-containing protein n=1 Tax=unclassified Psychrobacter TaxID=196806 RepID=UPI003F46EDF3
MDTFTKSLVLTVGLAFSLSASAADQLNNTKWTTYNDNGQPDAVLRFSENNGKLSAKIVEILDPRAKDKKVCNECKGKFKNKPLVGATVLWDLETDPNDANKYIKGSGIEPETGRTFSGKAELTGDTLKLRGYKGISLLGKTRILKRR